MRRFLGILVTLLATQNALADYNFGGYNYSEFQPYYESRAKSCFADRKRIDNEFEQRMGPIQSDFVYHKSKNVVLLTVTSRGFLGTNTFRYFLGTFSMKNGRCYHGNFKQVSSQVSNGVVDGFLDGWRK